MSCVFQNLAGLQNRYPLNQWQEILGNCDITLFLGCTDALTAQFISDRTGEASINVTSRAKQLNAWRVSNYTPMYRETSGVGRRKLYTMDEVLRLDLDKALVIIRGKNILEVNKFDYSKHPESRKMRPGKASAHVPAWRIAQEAKSGEAPQQQAAIPQPEPTPPASNPPPKSGQKQPMESVTPSDVGQNDTAVAHKKRRRRRKKSKTSVGTTPASETTPSVTSERALSDKNAAAKSSPETTMGGVTTSETTADQPARKRLTITTKESILSQPKKEE